MVGERVGGVYFSIWRGPAPRKVKKLQFLPFFIEKRYMHRKSQFFSRKSPKFDWYRGFRWWRIDCKHYFPCLDGSRAQKLRIFRFFRYKNLTLTREPSGCGDRVLRPLIDRNVDLDPLINISKNYVAKCEFMAENVILKNGKKSILMSKKLLSLAGIEPTTFQFEVWRIVIAPSRLVA